MPENDNHELLIAGIVADFAEWGLGRSIGEPTLNDDGRADGLVDILFEDAQPPIALEVTSIVDGQFVETARASEPAADRLWRYAEELGFGFWTITLVSGTRIKPLEQTLLDFMATGRSRLSELTAQYGLRDGLPDGVVSVYLQPYRDDGVSVGTLNTGGAGPLVGFAAELQHAVDENASKLDSAVGYERHLAVDLMAMVSTDPMRTPEPDLPESIDYLWVIRRVVTATRSRPVVWLASRTSGWRTDGEPYD